MEKIGLYFGSFNPIHNGHLTIANYCVEYLGLDKLVFMVTPQNPFKQKEGLAPFENRFEMVKIAIEKHHKMEVSDIERNFPIEHYTVDVLQFITENKVFAESKENEIIYHMIMGLDNWIEFDKWHDYEKIINMKSLAFDVIPRLSPNVSSMAYAYTDMLGKLSNIKEHNTDRNGNKMITLLNAFYMSNAPLSTMSSTFIRNEMKEGKRITFYLPHEVEFYINVLKLY